MLCQSKKNLEFLFQCVTNLGEECSAIPDLAPAWNKDFVCKHPRLRAQGNLQHQIMPWLLCTTISAFHPMNQGRKPLIVAPSPIQTWVC